ncbi:MAG: phospho-N-acetylmuramoyl-pentapeptide-transferase [Clostridia bacterium]|jgi:phospho-N-acetylmuramoyl-pentapeptide-transferase|nr:phospho-N-acetylmuramoyl-pentapeptide-transferase [Clostridia bacterium]
MNTVYLILISLAVSFVATALLGFVLIPALHRLKFGQTILTDIGPRWHARKQGTPTMGGLMFIIGIILSVLVSLLVCKLTGTPMFNEMTAVATSEQAKLWAGLLLALCLGLVGFADDYIKVKQQRNLGLTEVQKTVPQLLVIVAYLTTLQLSGSRSMLIPLYGRISLDSVPGMIFFYVFGACVIYGAVNAVNFTDGLDGLCGSVTVPVGVAFAVMAYLQKNTSVSVLGAALAGACAGYLVWNRYPAKVMMGDTGSMFLGGIIVALAYALDCPLILLPVGIVYVIEALSDLIQIGAIKVFHRKVFLMAPIHHHLEMKGWSEKKIVFVFTLISLLGCLNGVLLMQLTLTQ